MKSVNLRRYVWFFICVVTCLVVANLCSIVNPYDDRTLSSALTSFLRPIGAGFGTAIVLILVTRIAQELRCLLRLLKSKNRQ